MKTRVLYVTYMGLTEPLLYSQVLGYLKGLSKKGVQVYILSFEKKKYLIDKDITGIREGLDREGTKQLLGNENIDDDALKKIHLMTRGNPLTIELIKLGDVMSLKRIKGFSRQEASLLLYLKGVEKKA